MAASEEAWRIISEMMAAALRMKRTAEEASRVGARISASTEASELRGEQERLHDLLLRTLDHERTLHTQLLKELGIEEEVAQLEEQRRQGPAK